MWKGVRAKILARTYMHMKYLQLISYVSFLGCSEPKIPPGVRKIHLVRLQSCTSYLARTSKVFTLNMQYIYTHFDQTITAAHRSRYQYCARNYALLRLMRRAFWWDQFGLITVAVLICLLSEILESSVYSYILTTR